MKYIKSVKGLWNTYIIHTLLYIIACGNAETLRLYLTSTGAPNSWQLIAAIYSTELLIVLATQWGSVGAVISTVMFLVSMQSIRSVYVHNWIGHCYFSISLYCGAIGVYFKNGGWKDLYENKTSAVKNSIKSTQPNSKKVLFTQNEILEIASLTIQEIKAMFGLSLAGANILKQMSLNNEHIDNSVIEGLQ